MDRPCFQRPSLGFLARYANRVFATEKLPIEPFSSDGTDFISRLSMGPALGYLILACVTRLKLLSLKSAQSLRRALSTGADKTSILFVASGVVRDIGISADIASLLLHNNQSQELYDALLAIATLTATSIVRGLEQETLTPIPFNSACTEDAGLNVFRKMHEFDDFTSVALSLGDLPRSCLCSKMTSRAKSAATYSQNPHRLHHFSILNHATLILLSWMNYLHVKLNNLPRTGSQYYTGFDFNSDELRDFGNSVFGMYKLIANEGNVPINLEPYPDLKEHFLATKGSVDSFFRVTFSKKHDYKLLDFLVFTASFKCPFHDLLLVDDDIFHNPEAVIIVFSELFHYCNDLAYVVAAKDMTKKLTRTKRITLSQKAKMYEPMSYERERALSARSLRSTHIVGRMDRNDKSLTEQARRDEEARLAEQANLVTNWSEFEMFCLIAAELLIVFPTSALLQRINSASGELYNKVTTSELLRDSSIHPELLIEFCKNFRKYILDILDSFDSLFTELYSPHLPSTYNCTVQDTSKCKYLCNYEGDPKYFIHVGLAVLLRQLLFVLGGIFCSTCNMASADLNSFNDLASQELRPYLREPKDSFITMLTCLCALIQRYLIILSACDTSVNVHALKGAPTLPGGETPVTVPFEVYKANAVDVVLNCIISYSLCIATSLISSFDDISDSLWTYFDGLMAYLNVSYEIGANLIPNTDFILPQRATQLKHFEIIYRNYSKRNVMLAMKALRNAYVSKTIALRQAEKLHNFVPWSVLNGLNIGELDFNSTDISICTRTYYWVTVLEGLVEEIGFLLEDIKSTATEGFAITPGEDRFSNTRLDATVTQAPTNCLFVAPMQRTTFQYVCDTITLLFKRLYQMNNISIERSLLSQLLAVLIHHQDFGLAKLLEGADILLLSKLNITDPKQLIAMLRVFAKRTQSTILFSNPFSSLNIHKNKVDLLTIQPPDGHTVYLKLPHDSSSNDSSGDGANDTKHDATEDTKDTSAQQTFNEASSNYHIQALKPLMNRFKEIAFSYNNEPDLLRLFGKVFKIFFGSFPLEFSNVLLESVAMSQILIDLYKNGPYPGLFYILLPLTPYIALADKDIIYEQLWRYIEGECANVKGFIMELLKTQNEQERSMDSILDSKKFIDQMILSVEIATVFAESCSDEQDSENILQYLVRSSVLFKTIMTSKSTTVLSFAHSYIILIKTLLSNEATIAGVGKTGCTVIFDFLTSLTEHVKTLKHIQCIELAIAALKKMCDILEKGTLDTVLMEKEDWNNVCCTLIQIASELSVKAYAMDALIDILVVGVSKAHVSKAVLSPLSESRLTAAQREKLKGLK